MANFKVALDLVLGHEGGYSNRADDRGGETYRGISRKHFPNWEGWKKIDAFKRYHGGTLARGTMLPDIDFNNSVYAFYADNFGDPVGVSQLLCQEIANELMDIGINCGSYRAVKILQEAFNLCNNLGRYGDDVVVDGVIGMQTIHAINSHPKPQALVKVINGLQLSFYIDLCKSKPDQEANFLGWLTRC